MATGRQRLRNEVQLRQFLLPMFATFLLGFGLGSACYPVVGRPVLLGGPLWSLRRAVVEAYRRPVFAFGLWDTLLSVGFGALCLIWLAHEQRRASPTLSLSRSRYYRLALLALGVASLVAWPGRGEVATAVSHTLAVLAGVAMLVSAWPRWRLGKRIQAVALLTIGCGFAVLMAHQVDYWLLRDGGARSYR